MSDTHELEKQLAVMQAQINAMVAEFVDVKKDLKDISAMAHRWRGAFWVILGLGGFAGFIAEKLIPSVFR